jgi:hypothetical protein
MPLDVKKFATHLREHACKKLGGNGFCARRVREALQAGGAKVPQPWPAYAKDWGPTLLSIGFHEMAVEDVETFSFMKGDIMVMEPYKGGKPAGHIAGYDGVDWISDFVQRDFWSGPQYRAEKPSYVLYRP